MDGREAVKVEHSEASNTFTVSRPSITHTLLRIWPEITWIYPQILRKSQNYFNIKVVLIVHPL